MWGGGRDHRKQELKLREKRKLWTKENGKTNKTQYRSQTFFLEILIM